MNRNIIISGLTAAGKTTHAKILEKDFGMSYISASELLLNVVNLQKDNEKFWVSDEAREFLGGLRQNDPDIDKFVDQELCSIDANKGNMIFDTWGLAWISKSSSLRIWLESSLESRTWKSFISHGADPNEDINELRIKINEKDGFTRDLFKANYGFDIYSDYDVFDYVIDITSFIAKPTFIAAQRSIKSVRDILSSIINHYFRPSEETELQVKKIIQKYGYSVFLKKGPFS